MSRFFIFPATDLAREQKINFGDDISSLLRLARKRRWNQSEEKRIKQEIELQTYLRDLILKDQEKQIQEARNGSADPEKLSVIERKIHSKTQRCIDEVNTMFSELDIRRKVITKKYE